MPSFIAQDSTGSKGPLCTVTLASRRPLSRAHTKVSLVLRKYPKRKTVFAPEQIRPQNTELIMSTSSARKSDMFRFPENGSPERELRATGREQAPAKLGNLLRCLVALLLVLIIALPVLANQAENYYKQGQKAESKNDYDGAYQAYVEASKLEPKNAKYMAAVARLRF